MTEQNPTQAGLGTGASPSLLLPNPPARAHVFLSYSRSDTELVINLAADLEAAGIPTWIDRSDLKPGTSNWDDAIRVAVRDSFAFIMIATPNSRASDYVYGEVELAELYDCPIMPIWAGGTVWIDSVPLGFSRRQYIDVRATDYTNGLTTLIAYLNEQRGLAIAPSATPPTDPPSITMNPYKALNAFTEADADRFYGRDIQIAELVEALREYHFLPIIGASGAGKSSLVMAGVIPALRRGALPGSENWIYLTPIKPDKTPRENLAVALAHAQPKPDLEAMLRLLDSARGLIGAAKLMTTGTDRRVVVYIDQFEEVYLQTTDDDERRAFLRLLEATAGETDGRVVLMLTLRADFYDRPLTMPRGEAFADLLRAHQRTIIPMKPEELRAAIEQPARSAGLTLEDGLTGDLLYEVRDQAGALPLLQFTLYQLVENRTGNQLTHAAYRELGGLRGALARHAQATYLSLPDERHRGAAHAVMLRLVTLDAFAQEVTAARRRAPRAEFLSDDPARAEQTRINTAVIEKFVTARLLTADADTLEVSHEALLREWDTLRGWLAEARWDIQTQNKIANDAVEWQRTGRRDEDLYRGATLREAQEWCDRALPSDLEADFLAASTASEQAQRAEDERRTRELTEAGDRARRLRGRARLAIGAALIAGLVAIALLVYAGQRTSDADNRVAGVNQQLADAGLTLNPIPPTLTYAAEQIALAREENANSAARFESLRLAAEADVISRDERADPQIAALLAVRALRTAYTSQAVEVLTQVLPRLPLRVFSYERTYFSAYPVFSLSPDGRFMLTALDQTSASLRDTSTGEEVRTFSGHEAAIIAIAFSPDGSQAVTSANDGSVRIWEVATGREVARFDHSLDAVNAVAFSPDGRSVATGVGVDAHLWNVASGVELQSFTGHFNIVTCLTFSPDGRYLLTGSADNTARLWDTATGQEVRLFNYGSAISSVAFDPGGTFVYAAGQYGDGTGYNIKSWGVATGREEVIYDGHVGGINGIAISPDGGLLASASADGSVRLWDVPSRSEIRRFVGSASSYTQVAFSQDGRSIFAASAENNISQWEVAAESAFHRLIGHTSHIGVVTFSPDGSTIATGSGDNTVRLWDAVTGQQIRQFTHPIQTSIWGIAFTPDGRQVLTAGSDAVARLWAVETGDLIREYRGHTEPIWALALSPDGRTFVTASADRTARLWDVETGREIRQFTGHTNVVIDVALSPDGRYLLTGSWDTTARLWDIETGEQVRQFANLNAVIGVAFSPGGQTVAIGGGDIAVHLIDIATGAEIRQFTGHSNSIYRLAFSPDGRLLLTAGGDSTARLWDVASGQQLQVFSDHDNAVNDVAFSPDGHWAVTASVDTFARLWLLDYTELVATVCARIWRADLLFADRIEYEIGDEEPTCPQFADDFHPLLTPMPPTATPILTSTPILVSWTPIASPTTTPTYDPLGDPLFQTATALFLTYTPIPFATFAPTTTASLDPLLATETAYMQSVYETYTAMPTPTATITFDPLGTLTALPTVSPTLPTSTYLPTLSWTPIETPTPSATFTPSPTFTLTLTPAPPRQAVIGQQRGVISVADEVDYWYYVGQAGERLHILVHADHPGNGVSPYEFIDRGIFDSRLYLLDPDGIWIADNDDRDATLSDVGGVLDTDFEIVSVELPADATYTIIIRSAWVGTTGAYTLIIESNLAEATAEANAAAEATAEPGS